MRIDLAGAWYHDREKIEEFCRAQGIRKLSLFGSVLRDDFDPQRSDVDVLAELRPGEPSAITPIPSHALLHPVCGSDSFRAS